MSSGMKPDLSKIKKKLEEEQEAPAAAKEEKPTMSPELAKQLREYEQDVQSMQAEEAEAEKLHKEEIEVDEEVLAGIGTSTDPVFYRNTPSDNPEIRKAIEKKCSPMDFSDLVLTGRVNQTVPILENKLSTRYRSLLASENFWIERNAENQATTDWGIRSWMGYARLALSLEAVNGKELPLVGKGDDIDMDLFNEKYKKIMNMGEKLVELLLIHLHWFNDRVDRLYSDDFEKLKNG